MTESRHCPICDWAGLMGETRTMAGFEFCPNCGERWIEGLMPKWPKSEIGIGDLVRWKSQANASCLLKVGVVVGIISPGCRVFMGVLDFSGVPGGRARHRRRFDLTSKRRNDISYVVSVKPGKTGKAKRTLYHPRQEVTLAAPDDQEGVRRTES